MKKIKQYRLALGMKRTEFAKVFPVEIPYKTYESWENGTRKCPEHSMALMIYYLEHEYPELKK